MRFVLFLLTAAMVFAAGPPYAITNAKIVVSDQATILQGTIVMRDGLIEAVGPNIGIPADACLRREGTHRLSRVDRQRDELRISRAGSGVSNGRSCRA